MSGRQDTGARRSTDEADAPRTTAPQPAAPGASTVTRTAPLIPTQAGHAVSGPVPVVPAPEVAAPGATAPAVPAPRTASDAPAVVPAAADAPTPSTSAPGHGRQVVAMLTAAAVLIAAGGAWAVQQERGARADAARAAQARVDAAADALAPELAAGRGAGVVAGLALVVDQRTRADETGRAAVEHGAATLAASAQAGDGPRGALQGVLTAASGALDADAVSLTTLRSATGAIAAPEKAVVDAQAAWQAAEEARLAAEAAARAAAAEQARLAAAARAPRGGGTGTTVRRSGGGAPAAGAPAAAGGGAPAAPAVAGLPLAGGEASAGDVGAALNAHRAANGLGALSIVRAGSRVEHAMQMAASDSIWHSGTRAGSPRARPEIVGRVSPGNASRMINAYANSPGHNQQMLGSYSTAYIGAVSHNGWLYTSITFG